MKNGIWSFEKAAVLVSIALLILWCLHQWKHHRILRLAKSLPTVRPTLPLFGHLLHSAVRYKWSIRDIFRESCIDIPVEAALTGVKEYCIWVGPHPFLITQNPDDIKIILTTSKALEKTFIIDYVKFAVGDGLLAAPADIWKPSRKLIQPMFHPRNLELMLPTFNCQSKVLVERLSKINGENPVDVLHEIHPLATLNALDLLFGRDFYSNQKIFDVGRILSFVSRSFSLWTKRIQYFWLHSEVVFNLLYWNQKASLSREEAVFLDPARKALSLKIIGQKQKEKGDSYNGEHEKLTMVDVFASHFTSNPILKDVHFEHNVSTIMAGGVDTTSITLSTCLLLLAMHPEIQITLYEEIAEVISEGVEDVGIEDLKKLVYMDQVLKETMRLFPIFPAVSRKVAQDITLSFGVIPAGSIIGMSILGVHMNPDYYEEPLSFNPEHFSSANCATRHPFAHLPFSAGPRNCIGKNYSMMSMKTTLVHILREYQLSTRINFSDIQLVMNVELSIKNGFPVQFHKRKF